jgi:hypothetical protein
MEKSFTLRDVEVSPITKNQEIESIALELFRLAKFETTRSRRLPNGVAFTARRKDDLGRDRTIAIEPSAHTNTRHLHERQQQAHEALNRQGTRDGRPLDEFWIVYTQGDWTLSGYRQINDRRVRILRLDELQKVLRVKRSRSTSKARTKIGKAVEAHGDQILIAVAALMLQIEGKIAVLRDFIPNSPEAIAKRDGEISDFERTRGELETIREMVVQFRKNEVSEAKTVQAVKTFSEGVRLWWNKSHDKICDKAYDMGMFATAVTICSIAGASGNVGVALSAAMVGGKPVVDVVKALSKKFLPS